MVLAYIVGCHYLDLAHVHNTVGKLGLPIVRKYAAWDGWSLSFLAFVGIVDC